MPLIFLMKGVRPRWWWTKEPNESSATSPGNAMESSSSQPVKSFWSAAVFLATCFATWQAIYVSSSLFNIVRSIDAARARVDCHAAHAAQRRVKDEPRHTIRVANRVFAAVTSHRVDRGCPVRTRTPPNDDCLALSLIFVRCLCFLRCLRSWLTTTAAAVFP